MNRATLITLAAVGATLAMGGAALAQETPSQTRARTATEALNQAPADTTLSSRPTAAPPLAPAARPARTLTDVLNQTADPAAAASAPPRQTRPAAPIERTPVERAQQQTPPAPPITTGDVEAVLADIPDGPVSALPPLPVGYYSRGTLNCDAIWPREGDLAWLSATAFTIDFGGCEPGAIQQVTDTTWREDQRCKTELGGDAGVFVVEYEALSPTTLGTTSRLGSEPTGQDDIWTWCASDTLQDEARFHPDDTTRPS